MVMTTKWKNQFGEFQRRLKLEFHDVSLFERALTHRSYLHEHPNESVEDNERLEFLGDSILDFLAAEWLYHRLPEMPEGDLTRLRAGLIRNETLAAYAITLGIGDMLRLGKGEQDHGGRTRVRNLGGAFEAISAALYLDQGMEAVREFATPHFGPVLEEMLREQSDKDAKSRLQEWSQSELNKTPIYKTVNVTGPDHAREFTIEVLIDNKIYGSGVGSSKQAAAQAAAQAALNVLVNHTDSSI
jgi:ribonuclease III